MFTITTEKDSEIPVIVVESKAANYTILFAHANACDIGAMAEQFSELAHNLNVNVVGFEYTGYQVSE